MGVKYLSYISPFPSQRASPPRSFETSRGMSLISTAVDRDRVSLEPWEAKQVSFQLSRYDVSYWDVISQDWVMPDGEFDLIVGKNSMEESLTGSHCFSGNC